MAAYRSPMESVSHDIPVPPANTCSSCDKSYSSPYALRTHSKTCKGRVVPIGQGTSTCHSCGKTYSSPYALRTHSKVCKGPPGPLPNKTCATCQRTFSSSYALARHVDICQGPVLDMYECDQCGYETPRRYLYTRHRKTCTKPYLCTLSERCKAFRFKQLSHLECHLRNEHAMDDLQAHEMALQCSSSSSSSCSPPGICT